MASRATRHRVHGETVTRKCVTLKIGYATRAEALDACESQMAIGRVQVGCHVMPYECDQCGEWHTRNQRVVYSEPPDDPGRHDYRRRRRGDHR